jgi:bifunctional non-homologous end joining protein LigD
MTKRTATLGFIEPMAATLVAAPFDDPDWLFEVKWDGFRVEAVVDGDEVRLWTRGEQDASRYFGSFLTPPTWIGSSQAVVDGEVIALDDRGEPDFALLQERIRGRGHAFGGSVGAGRVGAAGGLLYEVFDLLHLDGESLLERSLEARKEALAAVLRPDPRVRLSEHVVGDGRRFFNEAQRRGLEGIVAKDRRAPYLPGRRGTTWLKIKNRPEQELVVGGWAPGKGSAADLGALLVGVHEDGKLRYAGRVGTGFGGEKRTELLELLRSREADRSPFDPPPPRRVANGAIWVRPDIVIRAEFAGWTSDGMVRQAAYKGLDRGKDPALVVREIAGSPR